VNQLKGLPSRQLYEMLSAVGSPPHQVFDLLREEAVLARHDEVEIAYVFKGFGSLRKAVQACGSMSLAMPKTALRRRALLAAFRRAVVAGKLALPGPRSSVWLGGHWDLTRKQWEWADGSPVIDMEWAPDQPSSKGHQEEEPYLAMVADGRLQDSGEGHPPVSFGIMCERTEADEKGMLAKATTSTSPTSSSTTQERITTMTTTMVIAKEDAPAPSHASAYAFAGFSALAEARTSCGGLSLPMPKTAREQAVLQAEIRRAVAAGDLSKHGPSNTIWLGGHWQETSRKWLWDDGTAVSPGLDWAVHDFKNGNHSHAQYLCMRSDGKIRTCDLGHPARSLGIMCSKFVASRPIDLALREPEHDGAVVSRGPAPSTYIFVGFSPISEVAKACGARILAMPKSARELEALKSAIAKATAARKMSTAFPNNTVWLGGHWDSPREQWMWDDGTPMQGDFRWGHRQPSATSHSDEPYVRMTATGEVYDTSAGRPPFSFGIMCQQAQPFRRADIVVLKK